MPGLGKDRSLLIGLAPYLRHVRMAGDRIEVRVDTERTDAAREALDVLDLHRLIGERQHLVLQPQRTDRRDLRVAEWPRQIPSVHEGTAGGRSGSDAATQRRAGRDDPC